MPSFFVHDKEGKWGDLAFSLSFERQVTLSVCAMPKCHISLLRNGMAFYNP